MFLRFLILLFLIGFIASCGMSGSEEERQKTESTKELAMEKVKVYFQCKCYIGRYPIVMGEGDTKEEAIADAKKDCPEKASLISEPANTLGECKEITDFQVWLTYLNKKTENANNVETKTTE